MTGIIFTAVFAILILGYWALRLWWSKLALAGVIFIVDPPQNYLTFPRRGDHFKETPIDGDHLPDGFVDEITRHFSGGTFFGFAPNNIAEIDWPIYFTKFAKGSGKNDDEHDDHGHSKKADHDNHGNESEGVSYKVIRTRQIPKRFDASLLCSKIDTEDAIGLLYLLNLRIEITNPVQFMTLTPIGVGGIEKVLNMAESAVESFNRKRKYAEIVTLYAQDHGKDELINYIKDNPEIEQLTGAKITNVNMPVWNLDDSSEASKAIKQEAVNAAKARARVAEAQGDVDVATKMLEKAGIDYKRIQKENEGIDDLRQKMGDVNYQWYVKYKLGVAELEGTYVESGNTSSITIPASGSKGKQNCGQQTGNRPTGGTNQSPTVSQSNTSQNQPSNAGGTNQNP